MQGSTKERENRARNISVRMITEGSVKICLWLAESRHAVQRGGSTKHVWQLMDSYKPPTAMVELVLRLRRWLPSRHDRFGVGSGLCIRHRRHVGHLTAFSILHEDSCSVQ